MNKDLLKLQLEKMKWINIAEYYKKRNTLLVNDRAILESELDVLYKRIELCKHFLHNKKINLRDGKEGFDCYQGITACESILNGTSNYAKLNNMEEYYDCEVLNE